MSILYILLGITILLFGGQALLKAALQTANRFHISKAIIGMTVVSLATSMPELVVSLKAALAGKADFAMGNVIGSNIANIGLVLGLVLFFIELRVPKSFWRLDYPLLLFSSLLLFYFVYFNHRLGFYEGFCFVACLLGFLIFLVVSHRSKAKKENPKKSLASVECPSLLLTMGYFVLGAFGLWLGAKLLIDGSVRLATYFKVSDAFISVSMVSVGTSIPELFASIIAAIKKEKGISLGNLIGSNIFNIFTVLGFTAIITPIEVSDAHLMGEDIFWMLFFAFVLLPLCFVFKPHNLNFKSGLVLLLAYACFLYVLINRF